MAGANGRFRQPRGQNPRMNYPMMSAQLHQQRMMPATHGPMHGMHATMPAQQMYMQQQPVHYAANTPSFNPYPQQQFQMRQQQFPPTAHHHYAAQPQQMMPMGTPAAASTGMPPTLMPDPNPLLGTTPHIPYLTSSATGVLQQQHHPPSMVPPNIQTGATKQSKAIKIVNPETMKEVDTKNLKKTSPSSSARSTPKQTTESEQVQKNFKQNVSNRATADSKGINDVTKQPAVTPNAIITLPDQEKHQGVTTVTTDTIPASHAIGQSNKVPQSSTSGEHQLEPVSEPSVGKEKVEQLADTTSNSEPTLPEQPQLSKQLEDSSKSSSSDNDNIEVNDNTVTVQQSIDNDKVIADVDKKIEEVRVVYKTEPTAAEIMDTKPDEGSSLEKDDMEQQVVEEGNMDRDDMVDTDTEKQIVKESDEGKMECDTVVDAVSTESSKPTLGVELPSSEELYVEEAPIDKASTDQEEPVINKEASMEDKLEEEDTSAAMETESIESGCIDENTGLSSLEVIDRTQDPMTEEHLRCNEKVMSEGDEEPEATEEEAEVLSAAQAAVSADNDSGEDDEPQDGEDKTESDNEMEEGELDDDEDDDYENEDGRQKRYERDFLLSLQFLEQCKKRPPNLMNAEYIRKELPRPSDMMRFDPGYYDMGPVGIRKRGGSYQSKTKKIDLSTKEPVELRKADKRWVRPGEQEDDLAKAEKETQELFRKFVGILNKLTPQKFETLANQALEMPINSEDRLKGCIDRIFIKALEEPNFSVAYAQLCRVLSKVSVEVGAGPEVKKKTFRSLLLTKCQQEFEKDKESDTVIAELKKKVEEAIPEEKKQLEEELSEKEYRLRHKYLGNIKFIGELFKLKMLSEGIMHECIRRLLQSTTDEEALECFAKLMFTIGKDLDHEKGQALIKQYMDRVQLIINAGKISSRIKFFLQDVVELRNANWVPRRENNNPKKIDQIHQEAKQEEAEKMRELAAHPGLPMGGRQVSKGSLDMESRKKGTKDGSSKMGSDWSSGSDKDKKTLSSQPKLDSTKFRNIGKPGTQLTFAPGKFRPGGSAVTADKISRQDTKSKPSRSSGSGSKRSDSRSGSISTGGGGPIISSGQSRRSHTVPDKQRERQQALELVSTMSGTSRSSSGSSKGDNKPVSVLKRPAPDALSEEEVEKKSSSLIAEFCQNVDYEAAAEEVRDMKSPGKHHKLVCQIINDVLEKPTVARSNTGKLFHHLIRKKVITREKFTDGFTEVLEFAEDIEIDVPKIWLYLAEIVVPVVEDGTVSLDVLTKAPASIMESGKGAQLLAEVLKLSEKIMGTGRVTVMWTNSTVSYSTFKISNVEEFKKNYGLQFLPSCVVAHGMDIKRLMELLRSRDNTNTEIMNCIEKEYPESRERNLIFIRDLGMALFKTVIDGSGSNAKYNEELFDSRITIVTKYIEPQNDSNHLRQLEFLYALQMVLHELEQPAGLATIICKKLSESGVFEDAAFHLWKTSGSESIGHGTTMLALKDFFDWLESTPVESDYSQ